MGCERVNQRARRAEVVHANLERLRCELAAYLAEWLAPYLPAPIFLNQKHASHTVWKWSTPILSAYGFLRGNHLRELLLVQVEVVAAVAQ
jgi:hypothetical protein